MFYFCTRRDGRVVDCGGLENRWAARLRGFESLSLRQKRKKASLNVVLFLFQENIGRQLCCRFFCVSDAGSWNKFHSCTLSQKAVKARIRYFLHPHPRVGLLTKGRGLRSKIYSFFKGAPLRLRRSNPSFLLPPPRKGKGTRCGAVSKHSVANPSLRHHSREDYSLK